MFLEEKIELLKLKFSSADFNVPFTNGPAIIKSIEKKFITRKKLMTESGNWTDNIKNKIKIKSTDIANYPEWLNKLDVNTNYWLVFPRSNSSPSIHFVYDCKPVALMALLSIVQTDFFIVDKKYKWLSYFKLEQQNRTTSIFKSGEQITPFET